jgi:DNA repair exonuclease SbcCD nuclease subunit
MKIIHMADTHLGYSAYRKATSDGINQREQDIYNSFKQVIDYAIKAQPDLVLHAGDLFDSVRPTNRAITIAMQQILRLSKQKIPLVLISGNHESPRLRETGHIFSIFDHLASVYPIYNGRYESVPLSSSNGEKITVHAVPQCLTTKEFTDNLKKVRCDDNVDCNVFMTHASVKGIKELSMHEFNELFIPPDFLKQDFDYIALGHYHKYKKIRENVYYPGSTECLTFADAGEQKGFIELEFSNKIRHTFIPVENRAMIDLPVVNCHGLTVNEVTKKIQDAISQVGVDGKILRVVLKNIPLHIYRGIDLRGIHQQSAGALHLEIKPDVIGQDEIPQSKTMRINTLAEEFQSFLEQQDLLEKKQLLKLGLEYISKIESRDEN